MLVMPMTQGVRKGRRPPSLNTLRHVLLAVQTYATTFNGFIPAGGNATDTDPRWSWQVQLLPYMEHERAYARIDFSQAWNAPVNREVFAISIPSFLNPEERDVAAVDGLAITHQAANSRLFGTREGMRFEDLWEADGTTATIMLGEIGSAFPPWARPGNVRDPALGLGGGPHQFGRRERGCYVMFVGGNGKYLDRELSPRVLELLADPRNGVPSEDEF